MGRAMEPPPWHGDYTRRALCQHKGFQPEWQPLLNDLDRLQQATIEKDGKVIAVRTPTSGQVGQVFQATGIALPANIREKAA